MRVPTVVAPAGATRERNRIFLSKGHRFSLASARVHRLGLGRGRLARLAYHATSQLLLLVLDRLDQHQHEANLALDGRIGGEKLLDLKRGCQVEETS